MSALIAAAEVAFALAGAMVTVAARAAGAARAAAVEVSKR
jgi:hypothetical protein